MKHKYPFSRTWDLVRIVLIVLIVGPTALAQAPTWQTPITNLVGNGGAIVRATARDANGNIYLAGTFSGTATFGSTNLTTAGNLVYQAFVAKWNPISNSFIWAKQISSTGRADQVNAISVIGSSVYIVGKVGSAANFGAITLPTGFRDFMFVAKLLDAGTSANFVWAQTGTKDRDGGDDEATAVAVSGTTVYVAGKFTTGQLRLGNLLYNYSQPVGEKSDVFITKLIDAGASSSFEWSRNAGGLGDDQATSLAVNGTSVYVGGGFASTTAAFGNIQLTNPTPGTSINILSDIFITKLVDAGTATSFVWAQQAGGAKDDQVNALAVNGSSVYVAGYFGSPTINLGSTVSSNNILTNNNTSFINNDIFITKIIDTGTTSNFAWAKRAGGRNDDYANAIAISGNTLVVAGNFDSRTPDFGATTLVNANGASSTVSSDAFATKLVDMGTTANFSWAQSYGFTGGGGGDYYDLANCVTLSGSKIYVGGSIQYYGTGFEKGCLGSLTDITLSASLPAAEAIKASLYPNPAHATTTIQLPPQSASAAATLTLTDALGRTVHTQNLLWPAIGAPAVVELNGLTPGLYHVKVLGSAQQLYQVLSVE